jgi:hypothetical protein
MTLLFMMNLALGGEGAVDTGQIPTATRYRGGYRVSHVVKMLLGWIGL